MYPTSHREVCCRVFMFLYRYCFIRYTLFGVAVSVLYLCQYKTALPIRLLWPLIQNIICIRLVIAQLTGKHIYTACSVPKTGKTSHIQPRRTPHMPTIIVKVGSVLMPIPRIEATRISRIPFKNIGNATHKGRILPV